MREIEKEDRTSVHSSRATETVYTGLSVLHRLHKLYGFNVLEDLVYDGMHNIPLNVVKRHLDRFVAEKKIRPDEIQRRLGNVEWTPGKNDVTVNLRNKAIIEKHMEQSFSHSLIIQ